MEEQNEPHVDVKEEFSFRGELVKVVLEHFTNLVLWEPIELDILEEKLKNLMTSSLAFETLVKLDRNPELIMRNMLVGEVSFMKAGTNNGQPSFGVVHFQVEPSGEIRDN